MTSCWGAEKLLTDGIPLRFPLVPILERVETAEKLACRSRGQLDSVDPCPHQRQGVRARDGLSGDPGSHNRRESPDRYD